MTQYVPAFITLVIAFFSFWSVDRAIRIPEASVWLAPIIWFSLLFIMLCLDIMLVKNRGMLYSALVLTLLTSVTFAFNPWHFLILTLGFLLFLASSQRIKNNIDYGKKIKPARSFRAGKSFLIFAIALVVSSQYYFSVKDLPVQKIIPEFNFDKVTNYLTPKILSSVSPNFSAGINSDMTVDQFIVQMQKNQLDKMGIGESDLAQLPPNERQIARQQINSEIEKNQELILEEGRKNFSDLAGRKVSGSEKITDVISELMNKKINAYFQPKDIKADSIPIVPVIALFLFLTIASLGSFLGIFLIPLAAVIFRILVKLNLIKIVKIPAEVEIIACE